MLFEGFPPGVGATVVPSPLLGQLLLEIDDLAELKLTLRVVWLLQQRRGPSAERRGARRTVSLAELYADPVLARGLGAADGALTQAVDRALDRAVRRGTLARAAFDGGPASVHVALNDEGGRRTLRALQEGAAPPRPQPAPPAPPATDAPAAGANIYAMYQDNIGLITPMVAEELKAAEETYPAEWIADAFREAVARNKRNWRYISRILERWAAEGRNVDGEPGRHPQAVDPKEYLRRYGRPGAG